MRFDLLAHPISNLNPILVLLLLWVWTVPDQPLPPAWSPDRQIRATTKVDEGFATPLGGNYKLLLNGKLVYPRKPKDSLFGAWENQHTILSNLAWSPDSKHLAFAEVVYNWEYSDPYNRDFVGTVSNKKYYLAVVSSNGSVAGYALSEVSAPLVVKWEAPEQIVLNGRAFDLATHAPVAIR